jgi:hypothetical protein
MRSDQNSISVEPVQITADRVGRHPKPFGQGRDSDLASLSYECGELRLPSSRKPGPDVL